MQTFLLLVILMALSPLANCQLDDDDGQKGEYFEEYTFHSSGDGWDEEEERKLSRDIFYETNIKNFSYHVLITLYDPKNREGSNCGGTIIGDKWILTAARCVSRIYYMADHQLEIRILIQNFAQREGYETFGVKRFFMSPDLIKSVHAGLALLELEGQLDLNKVQSVQLPNADALKGSILSRFVGIRGLILMYSRVKKGHSGLLEYSENGVKRLAGVNYTIRETTKCIKAFKEYNVQGIKGTIVSNGWPSRAFSKFGKAVKKKSDHRLLADFDETRYLCAFSSREDLCLTGAGDTGSGLVGKDRDGQLKILGVVTGFVSCVNKQMENMIKKMPPIISRVSRFVPWIEDVIRPERKQTASSTAKEQGEQIKGTLVRGKRSLGDMVDLQPFLKDMEDGTWIMD